MFSLFKKIIIKTNLNEQEIIKIISETEKSSRETHNDDSCHSDYYKIAIIGENFSIKRVLPEGHGGDIGLIPIMQGKIYDSNIELTFRPKIPDLIAALIVIFAFIFMLVPYSMKNWQGNGSIVFIILSILLCLLLWLFVNTFQKATLNAEKFLRGLFEAK